MKKIFLLPILILALVSSCNKEPVSPSKVLTDTMARDSLFYIMKDWYLWYNMPEAEGVTTTTKDNYMDPYELLDAMRYKTLDRWSFVENYDTFMAMMQGDFVGHGFRIGLDPAGNARIAMIYSRSPLYTSGVRRGWIVKKINNTDIAPILLRGDGAAYNSLIGAAKAGITNTFVFQPPTGSEITISSTKASFQVNTVLAYDTVHIKNGIAGHLVFESFIDQSASELATAFAYFKANNVNELILDLRYNSGGLLSGAQTLASYIAGNTRNGQTFLKFQYNDRHTDRNSAYPFINTSYPLSLTRVIVIASRSTASASETVMNGLKPFMNVISIGDTTDGKPTGMLGWNVGNKFAMFPVTFKTVNSQDQGDYFAGIFPSKVVSDDITHDFIDRNELCLKEAIHYINYGSFSARSFQEFKRSPQYSEKPEWMNNAFVIKK
jgi:carboxyl-terminal processing protease